MKKRFLSILLVLAMLLSLTACGKEESNVKSGKSRDKDDVTQVPSKEPTQVVTPTEEPTPTDGPVATPTPDPSKPPVPDVMEGPSFVVARGDGCDRYCDYYTGDGPAFDSEIDYLYITEPGFDGLAKAIRMQNLDEYQKDDTVRQSAAELLDEVTYEFGYKWYQKSYIDVTRNDSKVFAYTRATDSFLGGAQNYWSRKGYVYETQTGEPIDLATMITDMKGFAEDVLALFSVYEDDYGYWDNWKERLTESIAEGGIGWTAVDDGLIVWCNNGVLAPYVVGEVSVEYPVEKYFKRFNPEYIGAYGNYDKTSKYPEGLIGPLDSWRYFRSEMYGELFYGVVDGLGEMYWEDLAAFLDELGVAYEGFGDKEAAEHESDAYAIFYDREFDDRYFVYFWPEDESVTGSRQVMDYISLYFGDYESFLLIDIDEDGYIRYNIIDCSFDGKRDSAYVYSADQALDVMIITMDCYYSDIKQVYER